MGATLAGLALQRAKVPEPSPALAAAGGEVSFHSHQALQASRAAANYTGFICTKTWGLGKAGKQLKFICRFCLVKRYKTQGLYRSKSFLKHVSKGKGEEISIQVFPVLSPFHAATMGKKKGCELVVLMRLVQGAAAPPIAPESPQSSQSCN